MRKVVIVSATRLSKENFFSACALGTSIKRIGLSADMELDVAFNNSRGLPEIYNRHICEKNRAAILLFVHDDVCLDDYWIVQRLNEACAQFDVIGVAGNARVHQNHVGWGLNLEPNETLSWDAPNLLSGKVRHGNKVNSYGPSPKACRLLDGLFIAVATEPLLKHDVTFDPIFDFHFYDLDFSRQCAGVGLRVGTWPIAVTHASTGAYGSPSWRAAALKYRTKWKDRFSFPWSVVGRAAEGGG